MKRSNTIRFYLISIVVIPLILTSFECPSLPSFYPKLYTPKKGFIASTNQEIYFISNLGVKSDYIKLGGLNAGLADMAYFQKIQGIALDNEHQYLYALAYFGADYDPSLIKYAIPYKEGDNRTPLEIKSIVNVNENYEIIRAKGIHYQTAGEILFTTVAIEYGALTSHREANVAGRDDCSWLAVITRNNNEEFRDNKIFNLGETRLIGRFVTKYMTEDMVQECKPCYEIGNEKYRAVDVEALAYYSQYYYAAEYYNYPNGAPAVGILYRIKHTALLDNLAYSLINYDNPFVELPKIELEFFGLLKDNVTNKSFSALDMVAIPPTEEKAVPIPKIYGVCQNPLMVFYLSAESITSDWITVEALNKDNLVWWDNPKIRHFNGIGYWELLDRAVRLDTEEIWDNRL